MEKATGNRRPATGNRQLSMRLGGDIAERLLKFAVGVAKEVRESVYWLEFIQLSAWTRQDLGPAIREAGELAAILGASAAERCRLPVAGLLLPVLAQLEARRLRYISNRSVF